MTLSDVIQNAYLPAIQIIGARDTPNARVIILAIGLQESRFTHRRQMNNGPAMGFWQFESGGGVRGVLNHQASKEKAHKLCSVRGVDPVTQKVWAALETDDVLAAGFARLLLLTDPRALPAINQTQAAWDTYLRIWRPGRPHIESWAGFHKQAVEAVDTTKPIV